MAIFRDGDGTTRLSGTIEGGPGEYDGTRSYQDVGVDLNLGADAGKTGDTAYLSPIMGNIFGDSLTKLGNYLGGLIGAYSITGTQASTFPTGAVLAQITDGVTDVDAAVVAYTDGDSAVTRAGAFYGVNNNNSTPGTGVDFGLDLQHAAHDGFDPVDSAFYGSAPIRIVDDVCLLVGAGDPVNGTTGDNVCGPGSLYFDTSVTTKAVYVQTGAIDNPTWVALY